MVRLGCVLIVLASSHAAAAPESSRSADGAVLSQSLQIPHPRTDFAGKTRLGRKQIAPNAEFGFGVFGLKSEKGYLRPSIVGEINAPKQRRAAVGFSFKF